jgi:hypothetical protein
MTATTLTSARPTTWPAGRALGCVAGLALVVAGIWNALTQAHLTVASPPAGTGPRTPLAQAMHAHYTWYAGTVAQERGALILGMIGATGLVLLAVELRRRMVSAVLGRGACTAVQVGGLVWVVGALVQIGAHRAVGLMATHSNPIQTVNAIAFTTDVTTDAFSTAAFILLAVGMLALATTSFGGQAWAVLGGITGLVSLAVAYGYVAGIDSITTYVLGVLAAVLIPSWLVWTGRIVDSASGPSA